MVKRERLQVIHDILEAIQQQNGKIRPTHIMYRANLSHQMLAEYISELIKKGLITENEAKRGKTYSLTDKGFGFLSQYKMISDFLDSFGLG